MEKIALALAAFDAAIKSVNTIQEWLQAAKQNAEMTPEQEAEFDAKVAARMASPHWHGRNE